MEHRTLCRGTAVVVAAWLAGLANGVEARRPAFSDPLLISNPFHPFPPPGTPAWKTMIASDGTVEVSRYLTRTRAIHWNGQAIECRILLEEEFAEGVLQESSENYFAQADDGTVYYFGELTEVHQHGVDSAEEPSWLVGGATLPSDPAELLAAANPSIFMPPALSLGLTWKPEDLPPFFDEAAVVADSGLRVETRAGLFAGCFAVLVTGSPSEDQELKYYAPGVGLVLEQDREGWKEFALLEFGRPARGPGGPAGR